MKQLRVFISHSSTDKNIVEEISNDLEAHGFVPWVDESEMLGGDVIHQKISQGIKDVNCFLVILSKTSISSKWVQLEISEALKHAENILIIPILAEKCNIPSSLDHLKYVDLTTDYEAAIKKIIQSIEYRENDIWDYKETLALACDSLKNKLRANRNYSSLAIDNALAFFHTNDYDKISSSKIEIEIPEWIKDVNASDLKNPTPKDLLSIIPSYYGAIADYLRARIDKTDSSDIYNCKVGIIKIEKPVEGRLGTPLKLTVIPLSYWIVDEFNRRIVKDPNDKTLQKIKITNQKDLTRFTANAPRIYFNCPSALYVELAIITNDNLVCIVSKNPTLSVYAATNRGKLTCTVEEGLEWNKDILYYEKKIDIKSVVSRCLSVELKISSNYIEDIKLNAIALEFPNLNTAITGFCKVLLSSNDIKEKFEKSEDFKSVPDFIPIAEIDNKYFKNYDKSINWHPTARLRLHSVKEYFTQA